MPALGRQIAVDLFDCAPNIDLNDVEFVRQALLQAAEAGNATIVNDCFHHFSPHGVSGVVIIAESHIAIHTWPEHQFAAIDIFTCGTTCYPEKMQAVLEKAFLPQQSTMVENARGTMDRAPVHAIDHHTV